RTPLRAACVLLRSSWRHRSAPLASRLRRALRTEAGRQLAHEVVEVARSAHLVGALALLERPEPGGQRGESRRAPLTGCIERFGGCDAPPVADDGLEQRAGTVDLLVVEGDHVVVARAVVAGHPPDLLAPGEGDLVLGELHLRSGL